MQRTAFDVWIPTLEGTPIAPRRRVLSPIQETQAIAQAQQWLQDNVIETITNPMLLNNLVLVAKKDGRIRVCVDCTPANNVTQEFDWPLPRLQDLRYFLKGSQYFSRIDLKDAFFRIRVPAEFRYLTAFRAGGNSYQFTHMPFGLKTAPAVFQRFMDQGLARHIGYAWWYIDDILIVAETRSSLRERERAVRESLRKMRCRVNEDKSITQQTEILFVGLTVTVAGVGPNPEKVQDILNTPPPCNKAEAQSALGLVSYLRDFIPLVSHFTAQLYPDRQGLRLPEDTYHTLWRRLMQHLASAVVINHHWKENTAADLYTDASLYALGALVIQDQRVVALASRKLSPAETRYSATDREHLGLVFAADKFRLLLHQQHSSVNTWTDHSALLSRQDAVLTPRQARWKLKISTWIPRLGHVKGKENPADFISRWRVDNVGAKILA